MVYESALYKENPKRYLLFEIVLCLHKFQMKGDLILHTIRIAGTLMIEAGLDILYQGNNMGGIMRGINPLQFVPLVKESMERSDKLEPWLRYWWGYALTAMENSDLFEE